MMAALCSLAGQLGAVAHFAVVRHGVCATHGEAVHVARGLHGRAAHPHDHAANASSQASEGEPDHEHDHCLVAARLREAAIAPQPRLEPPGQAAESCSAAPHVVQGASLGGIAALALAPKNSPPV